MNGIERSKEQQPTIDRIREFFVDPKADKQNELARLSVKVLGAMQAIYASGGRIERMDSRYQSWLDESVKGGGKNLETVIGQVLAKETSTRRFDHKFFGQIHPQGSQIGILSNLVAAYMNTNTIVKEVSSAENDMEAEALAWFANIFGYDSREFSGNVVTGGTSANITALWVARDWKIAELEARGEWQSGKKLYVIASDTKHYSIVKACYILGENVEFIETPSEGLKTSPRAIEEAILNLDLENGSIMAIIGTAGGTETGMVDDLNSLADIAQRYCAHFHVDAAYGGPFILSRGGERFSGINRADSITVDPHKMLYVPYSAGVILFKNRTRHARIERSMRDNAGYLEKKEVRESMVESRNFGFSRLEGSMGSGGVIATWTTIRLLGKDGLAALLNHTLELTRYAYQEVLSSEFLTPLHEPETNTLLIGLRGGVVDKELIKLVMEGAKERLDNIYNYYISTDDEIFDGVPVFRFVAMHPYSTFDDVRGLIRALESEVSQLKFHLKSKKVHKGS